MYIFPPLQLNNSDRCSLVSFAATGQGLTLLSSVSLASLSMYSFNLPESLSLDGGQYLVSRPLLSSQGISSGQLLDTKFGGPHSLGVVENKLLG
jgi:hypothetical protein